MEGANNRLNPRKTYELEFVALMAFLMANVALSIDAILPALTEIGAYFGEPDSSRLQLIIILIFMGLGLGEVVFGSLSDSIGRKPVVYIGVGIFVLASLLIVGAPSLDVLLAGRVLQGIGLSAVRSVSIAIFRDTYSGDRMARTMSFIMTVFILIPILAPLIGQQVMRAFHWQAIFYFHLFFIGGVIVWFAIRQQETLAQADRRAFTFELFKHGVQEYFRHKSAVVFMLISGLIQGSFIAYLGAAQQIFEIQYGLVDEFPLIFGGLAIEIGISSLTNGFIVGRFGMLKLVTFSLFLTISASSLYLLLFASHSKPKIYFLISILFLQFLGTGFMFGNLSSLAMQPIGHIAGVGAAIFNFCSMLIAVGVAFVIGGFIQDAAYPLFFGFLGTNALAAVMMGFNRSKK